MPIRAKLRAGGTSERLFSDSRSQHLNYQFDVDIAVNLGVDCAIMVQNFSFWIAKNRANGQGFHDGRYWTYNSAAAFTELFPFWTEKQVRRILDTLVERGVIVVGNYNKSLMDRTRWFAFTDAYSFLLLPSSQTVKSNLPNREMELPKREEQYHIENTDSKPNEGKSGKRSHSPFEVPSVEECRKYAKELGIPETEGEAFRDHHGARKWTMSRGVKMSDWKAAMRTWRRNWQRFNPPPINGSSPTNSNKPGITGKTAQDTAKKWGVA